jgi:mRNA-degrading endonuclease YafQ of YafQ-DinJ toxin-antitoxin module
MKKIIERTKSFEKSFKKIPRKYQEKFIEKLSLFIDNEFTPSLKTHELKGGRTGEFSFRVSGDIRAVYKKEMKDNAEVIIFRFFQIGTHNSVY